MTTGNKFKAVETHVPRDTHAPHVSKGVRGERGAKDVDRI